MCLGYQIQKYVNKKSKCKVNSVVRYKLWKFMKIKIIAYLDYGMQKPH